MKHGWRWILSTAIVSAIGGSARAEDAVGTTAPPTPSTVAPAAPAIAPQQGAGPRRRNYLTWDLNLDGGVGYYFTSPGYVAGLGRVRAGIMRVGDPLFLSIGATYEVSSLSGATIGVQGEVMHLESGFWFQAAPLLDLVHSARPGFMTSVGWSVVGVEYQGRSVQGDGFASGLFAKIRIPLGVIAVALQSR